MNYDKYIGLPYLDNGRTEAGVDCWGLARIFYKDELGIELPSYAEEYIGGSDPAIVEAVALYEDNWESSSTPVVGDLCLFNIFGQPTHVGVYVGDNKFLHCRQNLDSVIESLDNIKWKNRFVGFYKYAPVPQVQAVGAPHPLKAQAYRDWTVEGTTVQDMVDFVKTKYEVGSAIANKIVVMIDGIVVPKNSWSNTVLQRGQEVTYKSVPEGNSTRRLILTLVVLYVAYQFGPQAGKLLAPSAGATAQTAIGMTAINVAGGMLVNAIAPVRPPTTNDPGTANAMNLFTGAANQANKFGAIPVVLGKLRFTGVLGATPYVESLTDTSILNTAIVWGFGPLDVSDICIGGNPIENYYTGEPVSVPRPVTLYGLPGESTVDFDNLYGRDVEQQYKNLELVNNSTDGNPWSTPVTLEQDCDALDIVLSFPEGMRKINTKDGKVYSTTAQIEIQTRPYSTLAWGDNDTSTSLGIYKLGNPDAGTLDTSAYSSILIPPSDPDSENGVTLFRYTTFCLSPSGGIARFDGAVTDTIGSNASNWLQAKYSSASYTSLLGTSKNWNYLPEVPQGHVKLYTVYQISTGTVTVQTNHLVTYSGYTGLAYSITAETITFGSGMDATTSDSTTKKFNIQAGKVYSKASGAVTDATEQPIWNTRQITQSSYSQVSRSMWGEFLNAYGVWGPPGQTSPYTLTETVTFPEDGYYMVEASADDTCTVTIGGTKVLEVPAPGMKSTIKNPIKLKAGTHTVVISATNTTGFDAGVACKITYTANSGLNITPSSNTIITFGTPGFFEKRKDAFNWVHSVENLPRGRYQIRARRLNSDDTENEADYHKYHKAVLTSVTGYDKLEKPMVNPPGCYLAKTAVRVQSTNKINGQIDGINAMVQTRAWDWDRATSQWVFRNTNNPASLFVHVLMHPANAFRVTSKSQFDEASIIAWHNFCNPVPQIVSAGSLTVGRWYTIKSTGNTDWTAIGAGSNNVGEGFYATATGSGTGTAEYCPKYTYNSVLTSTQSIMDTLRDICAAGLASPTYNDGKWGVIIDTPRTHVVQHFTPHNSWGFEATKTLPILPHAFRVTIPDESLAYQANELIIYNYGYAKTAGNGKKAAELFEQLNLPGVTNADQAVRLARWHFAQLKLRPEQYIINVDFEHLVCTRGDLVKVTHDVPQWGVASGRLGNGVDDVITGSTLQLTEEVYLETGKSYSILIRTNNLSNSIGSGSITKNLATITTTGYTSTVTLASPLVSGDGVLSDNLFMLGEIAKESQQCIVVGIEPSGNYSARITLMDYSANIYTDDLSGLLVFNANMATANTPLIKNSITQAPIINSVISNSPLSEQISNGNYQNVAIVSFSNPSNLPAIATRVQFECVLGDSDFSATSSGTTTITNKEASGYTFTNLTTGLMYKVRARYLGETNAISGPWSEIFTFTNIGKDTNPNDPPGLVLDLEDKYIVVNPTILAQPANFKAYTYRLYRDSGTTDLWDTTPVIPEIQSTGQGKFNLTNVSNTPLPRISEAGVDYRVACKILDNTNNYSKVTSYATIKIKTIV